MTIRLANGDVLDPKTKRVTEKEEQEEVNDANLPVPKPRQELRLEDLPAAPSMMNAVCAIVSYRLMGLTDQDICIALGCSQFQLESIVNHESYETALNKIKDSFVHGQEVTAKEIIANATNDAARELVRIAKSSRNEGNKLKAINSVLDRMNISGENSANSEDDLMIRVVRGTDTDDIEIKVKR